ncbi:MAG: LTA synthase family protein [Polaribacter sp.]|nr:LTA synthase family protein [Polaribacter sp.]
MKKKEPFLSEFSNLLFFWFIAVTYFFIFRLIFILIYNSDINSELSTSNYINGLFMGFRYDNISIAYFLLIPLISALTLIPLKKVDIAIKIRKIFQIICSVVSVIISIVTINYYSEYKDQFNHFIFMGLYDDKIAVFKTIITDFNPFLNGIILFILIFLFIRIFAYYENKNKIYSFLNSYQFKYKSFIVKFLAITLYVGCFRASYGDYPVRRHYAAVTPDHFINKTIINPIKALEYAIIDFREINKVDKQNPFGKLPKHVQENYESINNFIRKQKSSLITLSDTPDQIFLIIMESYDSWALSDKYSDLKLTLELKKIKEKGVDFTNFLPASYSTFNSLGSIITSIPYCGVNMSKIGANKKFSTSIFSQFKELGYETNYFYGGYLSWQNLQNFIKKQGADNIYGAPDSSEEKVIWGIIDEYLFDLVLKKVDKTKKSLNIILSTSHHSPYEVDVYKKGFFYKNKQDLPLKYQKIYNQKNTSLRDLGHLWYSDKSLGNFVRKAEKKYSNSLFAITGDHFGRKFINTNPTLYESSSVPFILYGNTVKKLPKKIETPGSHKDISATLIDIVAPNNFSYQSFGNSMFNASTENIGYAYQKIVTKDLIKTYSKNYGEKTFYFERKIKKNINYKEKLDSVMSLSWQYIIKGNKIK